MARRRRDRRARRARQRVVRLTRTGIGVLVGSVVFAALGIGFGLSPLVGLGAAGLAAALLAVILVHEPPRIEVSRSAQPPEVERGAAAFVTLTFRARGRKARPFTAIETVAGERHTAAMPSIAAGHVERLTYELDTTHRGNVMAGPLVLRRTDAFGLVTAERRVTGTANVAVRPKRHRLHMLPSGRLRDLEGPTREVSRGTASFHQLREYVPGDDMRHIHWRTTARTGTLMVKQLVDTTRPEIVVIVDNRDRAVGTDDFEEVVDIAATVLQAAEDDGFPTLLLFADGANEAGSDGQPVPFLDRLTGVRQSDEDSMMELSQALHARGRSLVFVTGEVGAEDISVIARLARGFAPAFLVSVVGDRKAPFIAPPGMTGIGCSSAAESPALAGCGVKTAWSLWRLWLAPVALTVAAGLGFVRAFERTDLVTAIAVSVIVGGLTGALAARRVQWLPSRLAAVVPAVVVLVGYALAVGLVGREMPTPSFVQDAVTSFLLVGLPAPGLDSLAIVIPIVLYPTMTLTTWASFHRHTLTSIAAPIVALGIAALLVEPVGTPWWAPVAVAAVAGAVLMSDVRSDLVSLPALVGTGTELRRQMRWWRPLVQAAPVLAALIVAAAAMPTADTYDIRKHVHPGTVQIPDPSPLAVAARWQQDGRDTPVAQVEVFGASPGRLRLAVLDGFSNVGWEQDASYQITGDNFAADPVFPTNRPGAKSSTVTIRPKSDAGFRAVPSGGTPQSVQEPDGVRFAPGAGAILADDRERTVTYTTDSSADAPPEADVPLVGSYPPSLAECPDSPVLEAAARQIARDQPSIAGRLQAIENWLLTRRIYDPSGPGGQTLGSVEQFVRQPFARGNLEAFVTTFAVLGRCAGVPTRVVVGFSAPDEGRTELTRTDVTAWVEVPLERVGWVPFDPVPTPEEQQLQAELAEKQQSTPTTQPQAPTDPPREVEPTEQGGAGFPWFWVVVATIVALLLALWTFLTPVLVDRRRRRIADPTIAVRAAWRSATDAIAVHDTGVGPQHTPTEVVRLGAGQLPVSVPGLLAGLAPIVDRVRYSGEPASDDDAALAWAYVDAIESRLGCPFAARFAPLFHPGRQLSRLRATAGLARRAEPWSTDLPDTALISSADAPDDIPDISIDARIGDGATGTVYRAVHVPSGRQVAVKVFKYGPSDPGFDDNRFDWEVRIAREVSGLPHLPEVLAAGITPVSGRPYLVSTLYEHGTLLDRVRRGGPMTAAEATAIGADVAAALESLHQLGVIHADVKPENIFVSDGGWVLGDLGSAWLRSSRGPAASLTPPYAAPEVWRGSSPTPEADLYSLALTMLFARTGQVPIAGNPPAPDDIVAAFPDLPIVLRALDPDARRRPRSVAELGRALRPGFFAGVAGGRVVTISLATPSSDRPSEPATTTSS